MTNISYYQKILNHKPQTITLLVVKHLPNLGEKELNISSYAFKSQLDKYTINVSIQESAQPSTSFSRITPANQRSCPPLFQHQPMIFVFTHMSGRMTSPVPRQRILGSISTVLFVFLNFRFTTSNTRMCVRIFSRKVHGHSWTMRQRFRDP